MATYLIWNKIRSHYHSLQGSSRSEPHLFLRSQFLFLINSFVSMTTKMSPRYHTTSPCTIRFPSLIDIMACFRLSPQSYKSPLPFPFPALDLAPYFIKEQLKLPKFHMLPPPTEYGEVIQLQEDQRKNICQFFLEVGIVNEEQLKVHGF